MAAQFGWESTADAVLQGVDLSGKRVLITGVSAGLGVETARALTARGAHVLGAARDLAKAGRATAHIGDGARGGGLELIALDLASLASVRACADALNAAGKPLDAIIANAAVMACPKGETQDGFETQFGTNHLGHFVLVNRLAALLRGGARAVVLSSGGHRMADVDLEDPGFERTPYTEFGAYGRSKTANILFAVEFDRRHKGRGVRAIAVHPGIILETQLSRHLTPEVAQRASIAVERMNRDAPPPTPHHKSVPQGAATSVWAAFVADPVAAGGRYCEDCRVAEVSEVGAYQAGGVRAYALDPERAKALWAKSEEMVGERF
ncbi:MAG: SDR family NAD(P)-dependent oxidoreductase [Caulobacteraceae bacterium]|nr:SDR family NAD(P)-dependent oxidoreductase [Caulobacteraceae bacterium]